MINDEDFVKTLKFALELKDDQCSEIFMELITKGFTVVTVREQFLKQLTTKEAIQILNIGVNILDQKANNELVCEKTLDLLCALIDSHCDKLIWEDESYPILNRAKFYVQSMTEMTTAFSRLLSKNRAKTEIPELEASADTDFIIERIKFKKIQII
uniref:Uncharacterized protein n=1 Tax=Panagrolaimus sp. JU765 TaxID=591449 RepID=A0AC34RJ83_9BILA